MSVPLVITSMLKRKLRSDRNHVLYRVECIDTGDSYIGVTGAQGHAFLRSVKLRWQKHVSRAKCENKNWSFYTTRYIVHMWWLKYRQMWWHYSRCGGSVDVVAR